MASCFQLCVTIFIIFYLDKTGTASTSTMETITDKTTDISTDITTETTTETTTIATTTFNEMTNTMEIMDTTDPPTTTTTTETLTTESPFAIRLENGLHNHTGRVGVYHDGQWGGICSRSRTNNIANVACRMLGYSYGSNVVGRDPVFTLASAWYEWFGNETDPDLIWMDNVQCTGTESSLEDCAFDGWGIQRNPCNSDYRPYVFCYAEDDSNIGVRLVGGTSEASGHVEVHYSGYWGSVGYSWHRVDQVVCRMLGYSNGISYGKTVAPFTKLPVWMDNVVCNGTETSIADCQFDGWGHHANTGFGIATALCYNDLQASDEQNGVRLIDRVSDSAGDVQVMYGGEWMMVCGGGWDDTEARIVCQMLGYRTGTQMHSSYHHPDYYIYPDSVVDIIAKVNINCSGAETSIYQCIFSDVRDSCDYTNQKGGVNCSNSVENTSPPDDTLAFHATLSHLISDPSTNSIITYDHLITSVGGAHYSTNAGVFTCTKAGTHVFAWSFNVIAHHFMYSHFVHNNNVVGSALAGQKTDIYTASGSATAAVHLDIGDEVWVRVAFHADGVNIRPEASMFTGFRLT